jgi:hypothetical protein
MNGRKFFGGALVIAVMIGGLCRNLSRTGTGGFARGRNGGLPGVVRTSSASGIYPRHRAVALVLLRGGSPDFHRRGREGSHVRHGAMGYRHDMVAPDLDPAYA